MKHPKFSEQQIVFYLRQAEEGTSVEEVCRKAGTSVQKTRRHGNPRVIRWTTDRSPPVRR